MTRRGAVSITPPLRPAHTMAYDPGGAVVGYAPPPLPGAGETRFAYDLDGALTQVLLPDGGAVDIVYDERAANRR